MVTDSTAMDKYVGFSPVGSYQQRKGDILCADSGLPLSHSTIQP